MNDKQRFTTSYFLFEDKRIMKFLTDKKEVKITVMIHDKVETKRYLKKTKYIKYFSSENHLFNFLGNLGINNLKSNQEKADALKNYFHNESK